MFRKIEKSKKLQKILNALEKHAETGITPLEIVQMTGTIRPSSDISEIRQNGYRIDCEYDRKSTNGSRIYKYFYKGDL